MKRLAKTKHRCRRCKFFVPPAQCRDHTIRSGRCGDWIYYVRGGKQLRRRYARPKDPATFAQLLWRARLTNASRRYSALLTDEQQDACIAAGAKLPTHSRLGQSGPLTGHQYWVRKDAPPAKAAVKTKSAKIASQVQQPQALTRSTWGPHRHLAGVTPGQRRARQPAEGGRPKAPPVPEVPQNDRLTQSTWKHPRRTLGAIPWRKARKPRKAVAPPSHVWYTSRVASDTITIRLRRPKSEIAAKAKPNVNAWVNQLIEQALGPRSAERAGRVDRPSSRSRSRYSSRAKHAER